MLSAWTRRTSSPADQVGGLLPDQHARRVGMPADDRRHHRRIGYPQPLDTAYPQLRVDDAGVVAAHPACARWVIKRVRDRVQCLFERLVIEAGRSERSRDLAYHIGQ